jgi:hypothetical protein
MKTTTRPTNNFDVTTFQELNFKGHPIGMGKQCVVKFSNGYGASIVQGPHTYGGPNGLYELAVFGKNGEITYDTPITNDVLGYLSELEVEKILTNIKNLDYDDNRNKIQRWFSNVFAWINNNVILLFSIVISPP